MPLQKKMELWAYAGGRIQWARKQLGLSQQELATKVARKDTGFTCSRKNIAFWEKIGGPQEKEWKSSRLPHPIEWISLAEILAVNGRWLFVYEREPFLEPTLHLDDTSSAHHHLPKRTIAELELFELIKPLGEIQISSLISIIKTLKNDRNTDH
jgi:transcriptional regulator with XRE-family HTH domain